MDSVSPDKTGQMIRASIDIGTNTVLLLIAEVSSGRIKVIDEKQEIPRLGRGVDAGRNLHPDSISRVLTVLKTYKEYLDQNWPALSDQVIVTATSAVRDAGNREEFIRQVKFQTGWNVQLLSGDEEADTTYTGALSLLELTEYSNNIVLDIGGGSTEIAFGVGKERTNARSLDIGSVRFTERYFQHDPPLTSEIEAARREAEKELNREKSPKHTGTVIGVAGTVTSLAAIDLNLRLYDPGQINGYTLPRQRIEEFIGEISQMSSESIENKYPLFLKGRGDVILAGLIILDEFLVWCHSETLIVSTGGIRHGILL